jgi:hypothetical protein
MRGTNAGSAAGPRMLHALLCCAAIGALPAESAGQELNCKYVCRTEAPPSLPWNW